MKVYHLNKDLCARNLHEIDQILSSEDRYFYKEVLQQEMNGFASEEQQKKVGVEIVEEDFDVSMYESFIVGWQDDLLLKMDQYLDNENIMFVPTAFCEDEASLQKYMENYIAKSSIIVYGILKNGTPEKLNIW